MTVTAIGLQEIDRPGHLDIGTAVIRHFHAGSNIFFVGRSIGVIHADRALLIPSKSELLLNDWHKMVQVNGAEGAITMGILVDEVSEVIDIAVDQIEPAPTFGAAVSTEFILAMGKIADRVVILLDVDAVLTAGEIEILSQVSGE